MKAERSGTPEGAALVELLGRSFFAGTDSEAAVVSALPRNLWDEALLDPLRDFLRRPSKEVRRHLLEIGFELGGGTKGGHPVELSLLVEILHAGSLVVDDIEDDSELRRGSPALHRAYGLPLALNAGNWLYFWPQVLLARAPLTAAARLLAHERLAECLMRCHEGQALDLSIQVDRLPQEKIGAVVRAITRLKTGGLLGLAASLGAIAAGASEAKRDAIGAFGRDVGVGLQMLDDLSGFCNVSRRQKAVEDLRNARPTWVWAWLAEELEPEPYRQLCVALRDVVERGAPEPLIERIRFQLGGVGPERVHAHLQGAMRVLFAAVGEEPWRDRIGDELARLERAYAGS